MAALEYIFRDLNLFLDGKSYAGNIVELKPPKLKVKTEEFRGGGMDMPVDVTLGMDKLVVEMTLRDCDPQLIGKASPREGSDRSLVARGAFTNWQGKVMGAVVIMRGKVTEVDRGNLKPGTQADTKVIMTLDYYSEELDGDMAVEVDVMNMKYVVNGVDELSDVRSALGL